jgi:hypothetical protein
MRRVARLGLRFLHIFYYHVDVCRQNVAVAYAGMWRFAGSTGVLLPRGLSARRVLWRMWLVGWRWAVLLGWGLRDGGSQF